MKKLLFLFIALFLWFEGSFGLTVQIGSGTTITYNFPVYTCYSYNYSQQIYLASEIVDGGGGESGIISKIRFYYSSGGPNYANWANWTVYLGNTFKAAFAGTEDWVPAGSMTQVFSGIIPSPVSGTWLELTLTTPFTYIEGCNLVVAVDENSPKFSCTAAWRSFLTTSNRGLLYFSDFTNPDPALPPIANYGPSNALSQIQLEIINPAPILNAMPLTLAFGYIPSGNTSNEITYSLSGANLTAGPVIVTAPTGYELSLTSGSEFGSSVSVTYTPPTLVATIIYTRFKPTGPPASYNGIISNTGGGAFVNVAVSGSSDIFTSYCTSIPSSVSNEEIFSVTLNGATNEYNCFTVAPGPGSIMNRYSNFFPLGSLTSLQQTVNVDFTILVDECDGAPYYSSGCAIWIDFNQDGDWLDADEQVYLESLTSVGPRSINGSIYIPASAIQGLTAMRIIVAEGYSGSGLTPCMTYIYGETEDYQVTITNPPDCPSPSALYVTNITSTSADLGWSSEESFFDIFVGLSGGPAPTISSVPTVDNATNNPYTWTDGNPGTTYDWYVRADCDAGGGTAQSIWTGPYIFATDCLPSEMPFTENFSSGSFPPPCWSETITNTEYNWMTAAENALCPWNYDQDESLISPEILITQSPAFLQFNWMTSYFWLVYPYDNADLNCYIKINGTIWIEVWNEEVEESFTSFQWYTENINLQTFGVQMGDIIQVRFQYIGADADNVYLDNVMVIQQPSYAIWTGSINSDWFNPSNWDTNIPGTNTNITIPAGLNNYPTILNNPAYCNNITLKSNVSGAASLLDNGYLTVNGSAIIERYFSGDPTVNQDWHLVSSPVSGATAAVFMGMYLQSFNEASHSFTQIIEPDTPLHLMEGYALYSTLSPTNTVTFTGDLCTGIQSREFTAANQGWNLFGNPFVSSIDWETVIIPDGLSNEVHYIQAATGNDLSYVKGIGGTGSQYIAPMQGFFLKATAMGTLAVGNDQRTHSGADNFYKTSNPQLIILKAAGEIYSDQAWIYFNSQAGIEHDGIYDAFKRICNTNPELPQIYSFTPSGTKLSINGMPETPLVAVGFTAVLPGEFTISAIETGDFKDVILEDLFAGIKTDLLKGSYTFNCGLNEPENRFIVHFTPLAVFETSVERINIYSNNQNIYISVPEGTSGETLVYNLLGQEVGRAKITEELNRIGVYKSAYYIVKVLSDENVHTRKVFVK